jgi:hypothetical protein
MFLLTVAIVAVLLLLDVTSKLARWGAPTTAHDLIGAISGIATGALLIFLAVGTVLGVVREFTRGLREGRPRRIRTDPVDRTPL